MEETSGLTILRDRIARSEAKAIIATDLACISRDRVTLQAFEQLCAQNDVCSTFVETPINLCTLPALLGDGRTSACDMTHITDRESGFQPVEFRL